eukprot:COSAG06_NODE_4048_length_4633_cov_2.795545_1_plen_1336_part_10
MDLPLRPALPLSRSHLAKATPPGSLLALRESDVLERGVEAVPPATSASAEPRMPGEGPAAEEAYTLRAAPLSPAESSAANAELVRRVPVRSPLQPTARCNSFGTPAHAPRRTQLTMLPCPQDPALKGDWEKPLRDLTKGAAEAAKQLAALAEDEATTAGVGSDGVASTRFRLVLRRRGLAVAAAPTDAQTVWDSPPGGSGPRSKLGREERPDVEVVEQRKVWNNGKLEVWLRLQGREEVWLQQTCPNGSWEMAPRHSATGLQTDFFVETNLRLLVHTIDRDPSAAAILLESARSFAGSLQPLSLFDSTGASIDRALQAMLEWLTTRAASAATSTGVGSDEDAVQLLIKLTVARGTLPGVLRLARFFGAKPELLRQPGTMEELSKLWDVDCFEPAAQSYFCPAPGSNKALLALWESTVFGPLSKASLPGGQDAWAEELTQHLQAGNSEAARTFVRENVSVETFAELYMPSAEQLRCTPAAASFATRTAELDQLGEKLYISGDQAELTELTVLSYILKQIDLLSQRIDTAKENGSQLRAPICLDATEAGVKSMVSQLQAVCGSIAEVIDPSEEARREVLTVLLRLLQRNVGAMAIAGEVLSTDCASELHTLVTSFLAISVAEQPHCLALCESCAELYAIGQPFFLRTPQAQVSTARELIKKLLNQSVVAAAAAASAADDDEPQPEPETDSTNIIETPAAGQMQTASGDMALLQPFEIDTADSDVIIDRPGSVSVPAKEGEETEEEEDFWAIGSAESQVMSTGRHAIQLSIAPNSLEPSKRNPQGFGCITLAIVRPDCDVEQMAGHEQPTWHYHPLHGIATKFGVAAAEVEDGEDAPPPPPPAERRQAHQVSWIDAEHWWRSPSSPLAGDTIGLLLDCDRGELIAVKNGEELGVIFSGLEGSFCFAIVMSPGAHVHATSASGIGDSFPTEETTPSDAKGAPTAGLIMERVVGSVLHKLSSPSTLSTIIGGQQAEQQIDVAPMFGDTLDLLGQIVEGWREEIPATAAAESAAAGPREVKNAWNWGRAHSSFTISADRMSANRRGGPHDYAAVTGSMVMTKGVHEWTMKIERDVDGTWVGVSSPDLTLGRDTTPQSIDPSNSKVWWWKSAGFTWQNHPHSDRPRNSDQSFRRGQVIKLRMDCERGELSFYESPTETTPMRTLSDVVCPVVPFVYFDYDSHVDLLSATTMGVAEPEVLHWVSDQAGVRLCSQLCSRAMHVVYQGMNTPRPPSQIAAKNRNDAFALEQVVQVFAYARRLMKFVRTVAEAGGGSGHVALPESPTKRNQVLNSRGSCSPGWAYNLLESSQLQVLLSTALALATKLIPRRKPDGASIGAALLPEIT